MKTATKTIPLYYFFLCIHYYSTTIWRIHLNFETVLQFGNLSRNFRKGAKKCIFVSVGDLFVSCSTIVVDTHVNIHVLSDILVIASLQIVARCLRGWKIHRRRRLLHRYSVCCWICSCPIQIFFQNKFILLDL